MTEITWPFDVSVFEKLRFRPSTLHQSGISLRHSKSFRIISSNQKLARALTSTQEAIARTNTSCYLATSGTKTAGSDTDRRSDRAINWHLFPRLTPPSRCFQISPLWKPFSKSSAVLVWTVGQTGEKKMRFQIYPD